MKKTLFLLLTMIVMLPLCAVDIADADKLYAQGNWREAFAFYEKYLLGETPDSSQSALAFKNGANCLRKLGEVERFDAFAAAVLRKHRNNFFLASMIAKCYMYIEHYGLLVGGKFERGNRRSGTKVIRCDVHDYLMAMRIYNSLLPKLNELHLSDAHKADFYRDFAQTFSRQCAAYGYWILQDLSDLHKVPQITASRIPPRNNSAPVDASGEAVFYEARMNFKDAKNDGERWRFLLDKSAEFGHEASRLEYGRFLKSCFGVQTLSLQDVQKLPGGGIKDLSTLSENETIAHLANGVKRFNLPSDNDFIKIFFACAASKDVKVAESALDQLSSLFMDRMQYERSAAIYRRSIAQFGDKSARKQKQLDQICSPLASFDCCRMFTVADDVEVSLRYRNASEVKLELWGLKVQPFYEEIKTYLRSNPPSLKYDKLNVYNVGNAVVRDNEEKFRGLKVASWSEKLPSRANHFSAVKKIRVPVKAPGVYLLTAQLASGNIARIVVWVKDSVILSGRLDDEYFYYLVDCKSARGVSDAKFEFFGWMSRYLGPQKGSRQRRYNTECHSFTVEGSGSDPVMIAATKFKKGYRYMVKACSKNHWSVSTDNYFPTYYSNQPTRGNEAFLITDRNVYRPGDELFYKYWLRDVNDPASLSYANTPVTLLVTSPRGKTFYEKNLMTDDFASLSGGLKLPEQAISGTYTIELKGRLPAASFTIEDYSKSEYQLKISTAREMVKPSEKVRLEFSANYYFGAPLAGERLTYQIFRRRRPDFICAFGCLRRYPIPFRPPVNELVKQSTITLDKGGRASIEFEAAVPDKENDYIYRIDAQVADASNKVVSASSELTVSENPLKINCSTDREYYFCGDQVTARANLRNIAGTGGGDFTVTMLLQQLVDGKYQLLKSWKLTTGKNAEAAKSFSIEKSGMYKLVCTAEDQSAEWVFPVVGKDLSSFPILNESAEIALRSDHSAYHAGDNANILIQAPGQGNVLVYSNLKDFNGKLKILDTANSMLKVKIFPDDEPNASIQAICLYKGRVISKVKDLEIAVKNRVLNLALTPEKNVYQPADKVKINLALSDDEKQGVSDASIVVTVYDEALEAVCEANIADIRTFFEKVRREFRAISVDDPFHTFFNLLRKGEQTMRQLGRFGRLFAAANARILYRVNKTKAFANDTMMLAMAPEAAMGGAPGAAEVKVRKNFADNAFWTPGIITDANGRAQIEFTMPDSLSSWVVKAWAMAPGLRVAQADTQIKCSKDFMLRLQSPRFLVEGDETFISAIIANLFDRQFSGDVKVQTDPLIVKLLSPQSRAFEVKGRSSDLKQWQLQAVKAGKSRIFALASTGQSQVNDAMQYYLDVKTHGMEKTLSFSAAIRAQDKPKSVFASFDIPEKISNGSQQIIVSASASLAAAIIDALPSFAVHQPFCETALNRFLPALLTRRLLKKLQIDIANIKSSELDELQLSKQISDNLAKLSFMQNSDGGWGWFSAYGQHSEDFASACVTRGLLLARRGGAEIPDQMLDGALNYLKRRQNERLKEKSFTPNNTDAFVALALTEVPQTANNVYCGSNAMLEQLYAGRNEHLNAYGKVLLALVFKRLGDKEKLTMLMRNIEQFLVDDDENQTCYLKINDNRCFWVWYGRETEANAFYLMLLSQINPKSQRASRLAKYLINHRRHCAWTSIRESAFCIEALCSYIEGSGENRAKLALDVVLDGKKIDTFKFEPKDFLSNRKISIAAAQISAGKLHSLELSARGQGNAYFSAFCSFFSKEDFIRSAGLEIKVRRDLYLLKPYLENVKSTSEGGAVRDAKVLRYERKLLKNQDTVNVGDLIEVEFILESKNDYSKLLLQDRHGAGLTLLDTRSGRIDSSLGIYHDIRLDRSDFYIASLPRGKSSFSYRMRAANGGTFSILPAALNAVYAPEIRANSNEFKLKIANKL